MDIINTIKDMSTLPSVMTDLVLDYTYQKYNLCNQCGSCDDIRKMYSYEHAMEYKLFCFNCYMFLIENKSDEHYVAENYAMSSCDTYHTDENPYYNRLVETTEQHLEYRLQKTRIWTRVVI